MNEILNTEHLENVSESLYILLLQLLTFSMKRMTNNEKEIGDDRNIAFIENDEAVLEKVNNTIQKITEIFERELPSFEYIDGPYESKLFEDNKKLSSRVDELQQKLINSIAKNENVSSDTSRDLNELIVRNCDLQDKLDNATDKNSNLQTELNKCRLSLQNVTHQLDLYRKSSDHLECVRNKEELTATINEAEEDIDEHKREGLQNKIKNILKKLSNIQEDLQNTRIQTNELQKLAEIHESEKEALRNQVTILLHNLTNVEEELEFTREKALNHSAMVESCHTEKGIIQEELTLKLTETQHSLDSAKTNIDTLEELLKSNENEKQVLENELQSMILNATYFQEELEASRDNADDLNEKIKLYHTDKEELQEQVVTLKSNLTKTQEELQTTRSQANELQNLTKIYKAEKEALKNQVAILLYNLTNVEDELEFAREQSLNHSELVKLCHAEKGIIQQELTLKLAGTQDDLKGAKTKIDQLKEVLKSHEIGKQKLENELQSMIINRTYFEEELETARDHIDELNEKIKLYHTDKEELQNQVVTLNSNLTKTQKELQEMISKNEHLTKEKKECSDLANYLDKKVEIIFAKLSKTEKDLQSIKKEDEKHSELFRTCENEKRALQDELISKIGKRQEELQLATNETQKQKEIVKACDNEKNMSKEIQLKEEKIQACNTLTNSLRDSIKTHVSEKKTVENNLKSEISKIKEQLQVANNKMEQQRATLVSCDIKYNEIQVNATRLNWTLNEKQEELKVVKDLCEKNKKIVVKLTPDIIPLISKSGNVDEPFYILNKVSGLAIGVKSASNIKITAEKQANHSGQIWEYKNKMLYNKLNGNVLTILSTENLGLSKPAKSSNQLWDFKEDGTIVSHSNRALDLKHGSLNEGVEVIDYSVHGLRNQRFTIQFADTFNSKC